VVETRWSTAGPADELRVSAEVLDMTTAAVLTPVLAAVEPRLSPNPSRQVVVAA
jgi:hypothetical protein